MRSLKKSGKIERAPMITVSRRGHTKRTFDYRAVGLSKLKTEKVSIDTDGEGGILCW